MREGPVLILVSRRQRFLLSRKGAHSAHTRADTWNPPSETPSIARSLSLGNFRGSIGSNHKTAQRAPNIAGHYRRKTQTYARQ